MVSVPSGLCKFFMHYLQLSNLAFSTPLPQCFLFVYTLMVHVLISSHLFFCH